MKNVTLLLVMLFSAAAVSAQEKDFSSIDIVVKSFYEALAQDNGDARTQQLAALFTKDGQISSVNHANNNAASIKNGSWKTFYAGSTSLYTSYSLSNDEVERTVDFYGEIASVHSLVYQTLTQKTSKKEFAQLYWMQLDLVYLNNRWHIDYASWTNQYQNVAVEEAILSDTIWHQLSK
jgi:hypothetical protein